MLEVELLLSDTDHRIVYLLYKKHHIKILEEILTDVMVMNMVNCYCWQGLKYTTELKKKKGHAE